ncbi:hypothetical protein D6817_00860 [Candidatus Pacearchaeota archaeon]|nr:MAG: hypothetical protein D6817_00860 [Candidatus Pacearchaeota archaeon]
MQFKLKKGRTTLAVKVKQADGFARYIGLMFKKRSSNALLFKFQKGRAAIHSLFVFFPFVAVWLDDKNNVKKVEVVKPFRLCVRGPREACALIEIPLSKRHEKILRKLGVLF